MAGLFVLLNAAVVFIATREPIIALGRWGSTWRLDPERGADLHGHCLGICKFDIVGSIVGYRLVQYAGRPRISTLAIPVVNGADHCDVRRAVLPSGKT